jgi:hypothetical protein
MPKLDRLTSPSDGIVPYPYANCRVQLERLDPEMLKVFKLDPKMLQTQKKRRIRTYTKEARENRRRTCRSYRKDISSGFNLLKKWVPGTKELIRPEILIETVNYIKKLENEIKEVKKESKKRVNYIEELEKKIKELETPPREHHPSEPEVVLDPTGVSSTMDVRTTSPTPEEELPEEELLANLEEELLESGIPDFNSMEDFIQYLEL